MITFRLNGHICLRLCWHFAIGSLLIRRLINAIMLKRFVFPFSFFTVEQGCDDQMTTKRNSSFRIYHVDLVSISFSLVWPLSPQLKYLNQVAETLLTISLRPGTSQSPRFAFSTQLLNEELWTNGRTEHALLFLVSSKTRHYKPCEARLWEVIVENSSADTT